MGKLHDRPSNFKKPKSKRSSQNADDVLVLHRNPNPSPEQVARSEALGMWLAERVAAAERMSDEEKSKADEDWEKFKTSINEGRYRKVILD
jgi:hypothetical protein